MKTVYLLQLIFFISVMNLDFSLVLACGNVANEFEGKKKQKLTEIINTVKIHPAAGMLAFYHSI